MNCEKYHPTFVLIAVTTAVYIYTSIAGGNWLNTSNSMIFKYGQVNLYVFQGAYYQLFTSIFIHASIPHIVGNMVFLFIFGLRGEEMFSLPEYLEIYLVGGLVGNMLSLAFGPYFISVGASGAIFALFGACVIYDRHSVRQSILGALVYAFFLLFLSGLSTGVNDLAHIGGLGFGLLVGYWIATTRKPNQEYSVRYKHPLYPF
jgi:rhomboid protease GluP